jgi:hypothetical protein
MTTASCHCGLSTIEVKGDPLLRIACHCSLCQQFNAAPFADIALYRDKDVTPIGDTKIRYSRLRQPPAVDRGVCTSCERPFLERLRWPLMPAVAFVPSEMLVGQVVLPDIAVRVFYDKRSADVDDCVPHISDYLASQWAVMRRLMPALIA